MKRIKFISDLTPDPANANKGTERGLALVGHSLSQYGAGRSILCDKNGVVIAGNKTLEAAVERGLEIQTVTTDGTKLVVVQREDLDLSDGPQARELAYADNRAAEVGLDWDAAQMMADMESVDLSGLFSADELERLTSTFAAGENGMPGLPEGDKSPFRQMTFTIHESQHESIEAALKEAKGQGAGESSVNENSNGNALAFICEAFLHG